MTRKCAFGFLIFASYIGILSVDQCRRLPFPQQILHHRYSISCGAVANCATIAPFGIYVEASLYKGLHASIFLTRNAGVYPRPSGAPIISAPNSSSALVAWKFLKNTTS